MGIRQVATRLTCFAVLSAIETDLRHTISSIARAHSINDIFQDDVRQRAQARYTEDHKNQVLDEGVTCDADLLDYTDFGDIAKMIRKLQPVVSSGDTQYFKQVATKLEGMVPVRNRVCHSRPLEVRDWNDTLDFANDLIGTHQCIDWTLTKDTISRLKENPSFVLHQEIPDFWMCGLNQIPNNLPLPEFDDTGFLGRKDDRRNLKKLIAADHPVISVVGEGGIGKTALALRCIYDLVENPEESEFEAVIWVSLKTKALTRDGAREIEDAITSTLGLFTSIAKELGVPDVQPKTLPELIQEIIAYLQTFNILLVIDNLETLSTEEVRELVSSVPRGSKVILTSRIGLGEIELRYKLEGMDKKSAADLMRQYASILNLDSIYKADESKLIRYCDLLYHNPLLIKWFVASVAAGSDPSRLLNRESDSFLSALKFCFENLFERLSDLERQVLWTIASARKPLNRAELFYLLKGVERDEVEWALNTLHHSSMLKATSPKKETTSVSTSEFALTDTAREYVSHCAPPPTELFSSVQASLKDISNAIQTHSVMQATYKYDLQSIHASTREQRICSVWLKRAVEKKKKGDLQEARMLIKEAKSVLPTYSESYRISGWIETDDPYTASNEYLAAIEYDPDSIIAYYAYAMFLIRIMNNHQDALEQLDEALKRDPNDPTLRTARALCLFRLGNRKEAAGIYEDVLKGLADRPRKWRLSTWDQAAECYRRWAEQDYSLEDYEECKKHINRALEIIEEAYSAADSDQSLHERLARITSDSLRYSAGIGVSSFSEYACEVALRWFNRVKFSSAFQEGIERYTSRFGEDGQNGSDIGRVLIRENDEYLSTKRSLASSYVLSQDEGQIIHGTVADIAHSGSYGFIVDADNKRWFFHHSTVLNPPARMELMVGKSVSFQVGSNLEGECAIQVAIE